MSRTPKRDADLTEQARIDGGLINSLFGASDDRFWSATYVALIQRVKAIARIAGIDEPSLHTVSEVAATPQNLRDFVDQAEKHASTEDEKKTVDEIRGWIATTWLTLSDATRAAAVSHVALIGDSRLKVTRGSGPHKGQTETLGNRTGPWDEWSTESLPEHLQNTIQRIMGQGPAETTATA